MATIVLHIINDNGSKFPLKARGASKAFLELDLDLMTSEVIVMNAAPATRAVKQSYVRPVDSMEFEISPNTPREVLESIPKVPNLDRYLRAIWDGYSHDYATQEAVLSGQARAAAERVAGFVKRLAA